MNLDELERMGKEEWAAFDLPSPDHFPSKERLKGDPDFVHCPYKTWQALIDRVRELEKRCEEKTKEGRKLAKMIDETRLVTVTDGKADRLKCLTCRELEQAVREAEELLQDVQHPTDCGLEGIKCSVCFWLAKHAAKEGGE